MAAEKTQELAKASANVLSYKDLPKVTVIDDGVFRLQIASDFHLEMFHDPDIIYRLVKPSAPYLALLGDIGCPGISGNTARNGLEILTKFLDHLTTQFEKVFWVAGNHEFYIHSQPITVTPKTVSEIEKVIRTLCSRYPNRLYYLDRDRPSVVVDGVRVVGVTLWSAIPTEVTRDVESRMNDYNLIYTERKPRDRVKTKDSDWLLPTTIRRLNVTDTNRWHDADVAVLSCELKEATVSQQPCVVLTHHAPLMQGTSNPEFELSGVSAPTLLPTSCTATKADTKSSETVDASTKKNVMAYAFASALDYFFDPISNPEYASLRAWAFGHTHWCVNRTINGIPLVANQRGYEPKEVNPDYKPEMVIAVARDYANGHPIVPTLSQHSNAAVNSQTLEKK